MTRVLILDGDYSYLRDNSPVIRLYGKMIGEGEGDNVVVNIIGMEPYFYIGNAGLDIFELQKIVENVLKGYIKRTEIVKRYLPIGYQKDKSDMLKIVLFNPKATPDVREMLKEHIKGITNENIYEADIVFVGRYLIDAGIGGMNVIEFDGEKIPNYGLGVSEHIYVCHMNDVKVLKDEIVNISY